ncbi:MAG: hypothetical protein BJ554DRAFT_5172 [Olpidium bornovanus]|uniref:Uncharacterized protein n=1 Tax=Olpidium bornovanus TaxID=278681 RepID=A0A8H7ZLT2_9FUNG|nr:MAG: hypothetical protein BJ554DRAFT_5172 [Olpidium bornovanus]
MRNFANSGSALHTSSAGTGGDRNHVVRQHLDLFAARHAIGTREGSRRKTEGDPAFALDIAVAGGTLTHVADVVVDAPYDPVACHLVHGLRGAGAGIADCPVQLVHVVVQLVSDRPLHLPRKTADNERLEYRVERPTTFRRKRETQRSKRLV